MDFMEQKKKISVVVTDLDNTLFDWVAIWHASFKAMLAELVKASGIPEAILQQEFKVVHEKYGTSEYAFAIEELPSLKNKHPGEDLPTVYSKAIEQYRAKRRQTMRLYPKVLETLSKIKAKGCLVVGYTESMAFYTNYRLRNLGLDGVIDYLYSPEDHTVPEGLSREEIRRYPAEQYELLRTVQRHTPKGVTKPNPRVLLDIIQDVGATPDEALYVGDSLMKDIRMAKQAGVLDVFAKYGTAQHRAEYELLRRVTHWSATTVSEEKELKEAEIPPTHTLKKHFGQLLKVAQFIRFIPPKKGSTPDELKIAVEIWKKIVDVQQHFNDLELRIRNYAITMLGAVLGVAGLAFRENTRLAVSHYSIPLASLVMFAGAGLWLCFYFMDRFWYHRLLYGAVEQGQYVEQKYRTELPELALTGTVGRHSPSVVPLIGWSIRSPRKLSMFYLAIFAMLLGLGFVLYLSHPPEKPQDLVRRTEGAGLGFDPRRS